VSDVLADAVVAAEDRRFYDHIGVDPRAVARAARADIRARHVVEGGSTITQQLVKNAYLGPQRTAGRKTREAVLAIALEVRWSKRRVLTAYLNTAYFGNGAYGIRDAARTYFGRNLRALRPSEAALLAALLRSPTADDPVYHPQRALARRNHVLDTMHDLGSITAHQLAIAKTAPLPTAVTVARHRRARKELAPHFTDGVVASLVEQYGRAQTLGSGLWVRTTLDARMQRAANSATHQIDGTGLSTAIVAIDAHSGELRALAVGGPAGTRAFDIASNGARQPGSAFKPFVLVAAYERGYTPASVVLSKPFPKRYPPPIGTYVVRNASGLYAGPQRLDVATWHSDNTVFARVGDNVGLDAVIDAAHDSGIRARMDPYPSLPLGALPNGVSPIELAQAYGTIANHGVRVSGIDDGPLRVLRVRRHGSHGQPVAFGDGHAERRIPRPVADLVTTTLQGVIASGTGIAANIDRPAAGKTGTTEHNVDAWFAGYTPDLVAVVWVGHPEGAVPMPDEYHGAPVAGGTYPAEMWGAFMREALRGRPVRSFRAQRMRYVTVLVDRANRKLADVWCSRAQRERFVRGLEPTEHSGSCPAKLRPAPNVVGMQVADAELELQKAGFQVDRRETAGTAADEGRVTTQLPSAGSAVRKDQPIRLFVVTRVIGADQ
jgi:penicillin-binding protein 1A